MSTSNVDAEDIFLALDRLENARKAYAEARVYYWYDRQSQAKELEEAWVEFAKLLQKTNAEGKE